MTGHMRTHNGRATEERYSWSASPLGEEPQAYRMEFPTKGGPRIYLVEVCPGRAATRTAMRVHFLHRYVRDTVVILEEGNLPHPRLPQCNMLVPWRALNRIHPATT